MKPVHGGAHAYKRRIALGTRQRRFDLKERARERERERERESGGGGRSGRVRGRGTIAFKRGRARV